MNMSTITVPGNGASVSEIFGFALSYNAYDRHGGFDGVAVIGNGTRDDWDRSHRLPVDVDTLRTALFFEQRRWHHFGEAPDPETEDYLRALVTAIREHAGGTVSGPPDPLP
jgi:hypothetical protein